MEQINFIFITCVGEIISSQNIGYLLLFDREEIELIEGAILHSNLSHYLRTTISHFNCYLKYTLFTWKIFL